MFSLDWCSFLAGVAFVHLYCLAFMGVIVWLSRENVE